MCGIFGSLNHRNEAVPERARLERTARLLEHRGPDGRGVYAGPGVGLVATRLSLLDLDERSDMPMWDASRRHCLLFNGEVYNYRALRSSLERRGARFRTTGDTEVVLQSLLLDGIEETLDRIEGMFAFALFDSREQSLVLARDRFGMKPLYIRDGEDSFLFASEVGALRPWMELECDPLSIRAFLRATSPPTQGHSFYRDVQIPPPGTLLRITRGGSSRIARYFFAADLIDPAESRTLRRKPTRALVDEVEERLRASVRAQLHADAPVGALCSGGLDSSLIVAMAARERADLPIFHANVVGSQSEFEHASALARHLGLEIRSVDVDHQRFLDDLPLVTRHYGHPFVYHENSVPYHAVCRLVRECGVKGVLSGEGADECFLGYDTVKPDFSGLLSRDPRKIRGGMRALFKHVFGVRARSPKRYPEDELRDRFEEELDARDLLAGLERRVARPVHEREFQALRPLLYHLRSLLHRDDCLGMAASVEARFPYLDRPLASLATNLPYRMRLRISPTHRSGSRPFLSDKWILREVAKRYLPLRFSQRPKVGFPTSAFEVAKISDDFFRDGFCAHMLELSRSALSERLSRLSHYQRLKWLHLEVWSQTCLQDLPLDFTQARLRDHVTVPAA